MVSPTATNSPLPEQSRHALIIGAVFDFRQWLVASLAGRDGEEISLAPDVTTVLSRLFSETTGGDSISLMGEDATHSPVSVRRLVDWYLESTNSDAGISWLTASIAHNGNFEIANRILTIVAEDSKNSIEGDRSERTDMRPGTKATLQQEIETAALETGAFSPQLNDLDFSITPPDQVSLSLAETQAQNVHNGNGSQIAARSLATLENTISIEQVIGVGGMGVVAIGENRATGGKVALKFSLSGKNGPQQRFDTEILNGARLGVPGLARAENSYATGVSHTLKYNGQSIVIPAGSRCFSSAYIEGVTFKQVIDFYHEVSRTRDIERSLETLSDPHRARKEGYSLDETKCRYLLNYFNISREEPVTDRMLQQMEKGLLRTFASTARLVGAMHAGDVIHRDLKPENILIDKNIYSPYLIDFGLSRYLGDGVASDDLHQNAVNPHSSGLRNGSVNGQLTQQGEAFGTPGYMAPEQATGDPSKASAAIDVYALGAILYQIYSGRTAIVFDTKGAWLGKVLRGEYAEISHVSGKTPQFQIVEALTQKAMSHEPEDRFLSAKDFAREVDRYLAGEKVQTFLEVEGDFYTKARYQFDNWCQAHPKYITAVQGSAVAVGALVLALGSYLGFSRAARSKVATENESVAALVASSDPEQWSVAEKTILSANANLGIFRADPWTSALVDSNLKVISEINQRKDLYSEFLLPAYDAIAGTTSDFSTFRGQDKTVNALTAVLERYCPGYDQAGVSTQFLGWLESQRLPKDEQMQYQKAVGQMFLHLAFKTPYHPYEGMRSDDEAKQLLCYLKTAREIFGEKYLGVEPTMAELYLERRARVQLEDLERVGEIDALLQAQVPYSALEYTLHGKFVMTSGLDYQKAEQIFEEGIRAEDKRRSDLLLDGREVDAQLAASSLIGLGLSQEAILYKLEEYSKANFVLGQCIEIAKDLKSEELRNELTAKCYDRLGLVYLSENAVRNDLNELRFAKPEQLEKFREFYKLATSLAPNNIAVLYNYSRSMSLIGQNSEAKTLFEKCDELAPIQTNHKLAFAGNYIVQGEYAKAMEVLHDAIAGFYLKERAPIGLSPDERAEMISTLVEKNGGKFGQDIFESYWIARRLARCADNLELKGVVKGKLQSAIFSLLESTIDLSLSRGGFGKDIVFIFDRDFKKLAGTDEERFAKLRAARENLPEPPPYLGYD